MAPTPESKVKKIITEFLKGLGPDCFYSMPIGGPYSSKGIPDYVCCYKGKFFTIEAKAPGRRGEKNRGCSGLQVLQMEKIRAAGGLALVVDGEEDLQLLEAELGLSYN